MSTTRNAATTAATFLWSSTRGALVAVGIGAVFALGARGMAVAGVPDVWLWLWGVAAFVAFGGGLCFWAISATATPAARRPPRQTRPASTSALVDGDTLTYWYAAGLALLLNMLATAALISSVDMYMSQAIGPYIPLGVVCNLAGYVVVLGALRQK